MTCAADDDLTHPCLEALVAGTVALMSCWAAPSDNGPTSARQQRTAMARKIVSNLYFLKNHPHASPGLRHVMAMAHERWIVVSDASSDASVVTQPDPTLADPLGLPPISTLMH
ncbi:hypothetical protein ACLBKS_07870 [Hylemonella sp. W303a]|uniref:hypothetical protein n=1 Tax=Hylemonella sp. W303a TaxID=3389873 RepID=UPI00396B4790